jgi:hypothetical protein
MGSGGVNSWEKLAKLNAAEKMIGQMKIFFKNCMVSPRRMKWVCAINLSRKV